MEMEVVSHLAVHIHCVLIPIYFYLIFFVFIYNSNDSQFQALVSMSTSGSEVLTKPVNPLVVLRATSISFLSPFRYSQQPKWPSGLSLCIGVDK